ncbi:MAG: hypothetical protein OEV92_05285 [Nitrospinota bacterium]|nr:hypothetical protein [Nitrospinota bacterium]
MNIALAGLGIMLAAVIPQWNAYKEKQACGNIQSVLAEVAKKNEEYFKLHNVYSSNIHDLKGVEDLSLRENVTIKLDSANLSEKWRAVGSHSGCGYGDAAYAWEPGNGLSRIEASDQ